LAASVEQSGGDDAATTLTVNTTWRAQQPLSQDYTLFVHVLDAAGALVAQHDGVPVGGFLPTRAWRPTLAVRDKIEIPLPSNLPRGEYRVVTGLYDSVTLARLPVTENVSA
jgi:hypothetical protein